MKPSAIQIAGLSFSFCHPFQRPPTVRYMGSLLIPLTLVYLFAFLLVSDLHKLMRCWWFLPCKAYGLDQSYQPPVFFKQSLKFVMVNQSPGCTTGCSHAHFEWSCSAPYKTTHCSTMGFSSLATPGLQCWRVITKCLLYNFSWNQFCLVLLYQIVSGNYWTTFTSCWKSWGAVELASRIINKKGELVKTHLNRNVL